MRLAEAKRPWDELVERVRTGPPALSPTRIDAVDRAINTVEYFVHHEDVRRAQPGWTARDLPPDLVADLTASLRRSARILARKAPVGVVLKAAAAPAAPATIIAHRGDPSVTISGPVGELTLYLFGRTDVADVELDGPADAVEQLRAVSFGL